MLARTTPITLLAPRVGATAFLLAALLGLPACDSSDAPRRELWSADADANGHTDATPTTLAANARVAEALPLADTQAFEDAKRGLIAREPRVLVGAADAPIWDTADYSYQESYEAGAAPRTVNPSSRSGSTRCAEPATTSSPTPRTTGHAAGRSWRS